MLLVVDTNVLGIDPPMAGNAMQRLLDAASQGDVQLAVPDLVIREAANAWASEVTEQIRLSTKATLRLSALGLHSQGQKWPSFDKLRAGKESALREQLTAVKAIMPELPEAGHLPVVERALRREKPFDAHGKDGYRDTLIWETIISLARTEDVLFVSRDVRAYFESKGESSIDKKLAGELKKRCGRPGAVRLFFDLEEALNEAERRHQSEQGERDREARRLIVAALDEPDRRESITEQLSDAIYASELEWGDIGALLPHRRTHEIWIENIEDIGEIRATSVHQLTDRVLVELRAIMLVAVKARLPSSVAAFIEEEEKAEVVVLDRIEDEPGDVGVSALRTVSAIFEATFDVDAREMTSARLQKLRRHRAGRPAPAHRSIPSPPEA